MTTVKYAACDQKVSKVKSSHPAIVAHRRLLYRIILWSTVVLYTAGLPYVIIVYRSIVQHFTPRIAGKVPFLIIIAMAAFYTIICVIVKRTVNCFMVLAVSGLIVIFVINFEANTNKYIHIPEYVLISWILYYALALDYKGSGILLLVFICAVMLGVVDEIMQGMHPQRSYGWKDMIINAASGFIGCLSIMGLKQPAEADWAWCGNFEQFKPFLAVGIFGATTAVPMCYFLFHFENQGGVLNGYPFWLFTASAIFLAACFALIGFHRRHRQNIGLPRSKLIPTESANKTTAMLWVICPLAILVVMHSLVLWVTAAGINFQ